MDLRGRNFLLKKIPDVPMFSPKVRQLPPGASAGRPLNEELIQIMAITGNSSYISTINQFLAHWGQCNTALGATPLLIHRADNTTVTKAQFTTQRDALQTQINTIQACLTAQQIARGNINARKAALLTQFNLFVAVLDAYYRQTDFYQARPYAPSFSDGQEVFSRPLGNVMSLWVKLNAGPAPAGVTLPLVLPGGMDQGTFASAVSGLLFAYADEEVKAQDLTLARAARNRLQTEAYALMKAYRETVPVRLTAFPDLIATLPRLTPLPGHTPVPVNASAVFEAPNASKVVYEASQDGLLERYELRGNVGDHYSDEDAIVIATNLPGDAREFVTTFGLTQPGAEIALKVFVVLTTGNEAGSAALLVERPLALPLAA